MRLLALAIDVLMSTSPFILPCSSRGVPSSALGAREMNVSIGHIHTPLSPVASMMNVAPRSMHTMATWFMSLEPRPLVDATMEREKLLAVFMLAQQNRRSPLRSFAVFCAIAAAIEPSRPSISPHRFMLNANFTVVVVIVSYNRFQKSVRPHCGVFNVVFLLYCLCQCGYVAYVV